MARHNGHNERLDVGEDGMVRIGHSKLFRLDEENGGVEFLLRGRHGERTKTVVPADEVIAVVRRCKKNRRLFSDDDYDYDE